MQLSTFTELLPFKNLRAEFFKTGKLQVMTILRGASFLGLILVVGAIQSPRSVFASEDQQILAKSLAHYMMGEIADLFEDNDEGIEQYKQSIQYDHDNYASHLRLGIDYARIGSLQPAMDELFLSSKLNPEDMKSHYLLALIYSAQNEFDKAASEYELILKHFAQTDPENIEIYSRLGQLYYSEGKFTKAIEQFEKIRSLDPKNAEVLYVLGSLWLELGDRTKAVDSFKQSLVIDEKNEGSLNSLGYMYAEDGVNLDEALSLVKRALQLSPNNGAYLDSLGWIYYKKGQYSESLESLQKANSLLEDPVIYDHLGDVYLKLNEIDKAKKYWNLSLKLSPKQTGIIKKLKDSEGTQSQKEALSKQPSDYSRSLGDDLSDPSVRKAGMKSHDENAAVHATGEVKSKEISY